MPQPYLVPVSFSESRSTHNNGVSGSTSTLWAMPLTISEIDMPLPPRAIDCGLACARLRRDYSEKIGVWMHSAASHAADAAILSLTPPLLKVRLPVITGVARMPLLNLRRSESCPVTPCCC